MWLVVGLGNPGIEYQWTPHNAGFLAVDRLAARLGVAVNNRRCRALTAKATLAGQQVLLVKPETYMNLSGMAVGALLGELDSAEASRVVVMYDDVDFPLGAIRVKERGSSAGHNGVKSITGALGTDEWLRVRIGIAPEEARAAESARRSRKEYVLEPFRKAELAVLDVALDKAADAVETILREGASAAMTRFNRRDESPAGEKQQ